MLFRSMPTLPCEKHYASPEFVCVAVLILICGVFGVLHITLRIAHRLDDREQRLRGALTALRQSRNAIQDIQGRRARFMLTAAHQLKSPMAAIQTMTALIHDGYVEGDGIKKTCERIIERCQQGITAVTELLTLARVQDSDPVRHRTAIANAREFLKNVKIRFYSPQNMNGPVPNLSAGISMPLAADPNPMFENGVFRSGANRLMNSRAHDGRGQNVLFTDGSTVFLRTPVIGERKDNIWEVENVERYTGLETQKSATDAFLIP